MLVHIGGKGVFIGLAAFLDELFHHALAAGAAQDAFVVGGNMDEDEFGVVLTGDVVGVLSHVVGIFRKADAADDIGKNRHGILLFS